MTDAQPPFEVDQDETDQTLLKVGQRIRTLRQAEGMTLSSLAGQTRLSTGMISLIERGRAQPSLRSLAAIAHVFGLSLSQLIAGPDEVESENALVTPYQKVPVLLTPDGVRRRMLREDRLRGVDVTINEYAPGVSNSALGLQHAGYEYGFILEGNLSIEVEHQPYQLGPGDLIGIDSSRLHKITNTSDRPVRALWFNLGMGLGDSPDDPPTSA